jgi:nicotinamide-nucleotide amidase
MAQAGKTLTLAESCTGGYLAKLVTDIPHSSAVFWGGCVVYSNEAKREFAGVRPQTLDSHGAVSEQTVSELLEGCLARSPADFCVAISGIAGPGGGSRDKPVGTVWIGVRARTGAREIKLFRFSGSRAGVRKRACRAALGMLLGLLD